MFKRAWLSVRRNRGRTIIFSAILFVIANLVLSSIAIRSATEEAIVEARTSLEPIITLTTNRDAVFDFIKEYKEENGVRPSQDEINALLVPITSEVAYGIVTATPYVIDYNLSYSTTTFASGFLPVADDGTLDEENLEKLSITGTYNPLMLSQFGETGTYDLTEESVSFDGSSTGVVIISYNLATANSLTIGDTIGLIAYDESVINYTIAGLFYTDDITDSNTKSTSDNEVFMPLDDALVLKGQDPAVSFVITSASYWIDDPLNIDAFITQATAAFTELSSGDLVFSDLDYDAITAPLESVADLSNLILWISIAAAIVILSLMIINTMKDRKYEIGVLLSLGEEKLKIALQYVVELALVASVIFILSLSTSHFVSNYLGDTLLSNEVTQLTEDATETTTTSGGGGGGGASSTTVVTVPTVDYSTLTMDVTISVMDFTTTLGVGMLIIILSSLIPSLYIMRYQPKQILSSRL